MVVLQVKRELKETEALLVRQDVLALMASPDKTAARERKESEESWATGDLWDLEERLATLVLQGNEEHQVLQGRKETPDPLGTLGKLVPSVSAETVGLEGLWASKVTLEYLEAGEKRAPRAAEGRRVLLGSQELRVPGGCRVLQVQWVPQVNKDLMDPRE